MEGKVQMAVRSCHLSRQQQSSHVMTAEMTKQQCLEASPGKEATSHKQPGNKSQHTATSECDLSFYFNLIV
jgi:hypothetical protein